MRKFKLKYIAYIILAILLILGIYDKFSNETKIVEINGVKFKLELPDTPDEFSKGLSVRDSLAENEGMLFVFEDKGYLTFWMKDMKFPIDLLWIDGNMVVGWEKNMLPPQEGLPESMYKKYSSSQPVNVVIELPAGTIDRLNIQKGQKIEL